MRFARTFTLTTGLLLATVGVAGLLVTSPTALHAQDQEAPVDVLIHRTDSGRKELKDGQVSEATYEVVKYAGRRSAEVPAADVVSITWGDAPREYAQGWAAVNSGDGERAIAEFEIALRAHIALDLRDWVVEYSNVGLGEGYRLAGVVDTANFAKAIAAYDKARKKNPKSFMLDVILSGIADASLAMDKPQDALKAAADLERAATAAKRPIWELRALAMKGRAERASGNFDAAARAYKDLAATAEKLAGDAGPARKDTVQAFLQQGVSEQGWMMVEKAVKSKSAADFGTAKSYFEGLATRYGDVRPIMAARANALGVIQLENGGDVPAALEQFQRAQVLYFGSSQEEARSLFYQARCLEQMGDDKARQARIEELKQYFPESEWARRL